MKKLAALTAFFKTKFLAVKSTKKAKITFRDFFQYCRFFRPDLILNLL